MQAFIYEKLLRQSKHERRIADQLMLVKNEKQVIHENRIYRDEQYSKMRCKEYQDAIDREYLLFEKAREEFKISTKLQMDRHQEILESKKIKRLEKSTSFCRFIVDELLLLVFKVIDYKKIDENKNVPSKKMREWKILFANNISLFEPQVIPLLNDFIPKADEEEPVEDNIIPQNSNLTEGIKLLDHQEFLEYIECTGFWPVINAPLKNDVLVNVIEDISRLTLVTPKNLNIPELPRVSLTICMLGKKFSGKNTITQKLAAQYGLDIIRVDDLIKDAINEADITVKKVKENSESRKEVSKLSKQQIGAKIRLQLMEGHSPDDALVIDLIALTLNQLSESGGGWILVNFPNTREQAVLLEKELTGYEDAKPIKKGDIKRHKDSGKGSQRNKTLIAATDTTNEIPITPPTSGIDLVFLIDIPNEVALSRAAGQMVDPISNEKYHIESDPPPKDVPGMYDRIAPADDDSGNNSQLQYLLAAFEEEEEALKEWYSKFKNLRIIDGQLDPVSEFDIIQSALRDAVEHKKEELEKKDFAALKTEDPNIVNLDIDKKDNSKPDSRIASAKNQKTAAQEMSIDLAADLERKVAIMVSEHVKREKNHPSKQLAQIFIEQWSTIESSYTDILKFCFRSLRREHQNSMTYFYNTKSNFSKFLSRPDKEQNLVDLFQAEYNAIDEDLRSDPDVKAELHQRSEDLRDKLWEVSDKRREEVEAERMAIIEDRWVEDYSVILANIYITMMQAELDRFQSTRQLLT